ncbi:hypothetical protein ABIE44_003065 [Marmoricola sp. OAE513]|uniref:hypothetical protein n=1 Tax=Marmoricola sp. OAE513 TaxID=2817894 RepID=UPI001AE8E1FF
MPRIIPLADRVDGVREAVHTITLRDGIEGITHLAVAQEIYASASTLKRMFASASDLPVLGLQWVERRTRYRRGLAASRELDEGHPAARLGNMLIRELPHDRTLADHARVWSALTSGFARHDWSIAAVNAKQLYLASLVDEIVPDELPEEIRPFEASRLLAVHLGAEAGVVADTLRPEESADVVSRHLEERFAAWQREGLLGAA